MEVTEQDRLLLRQQLTDVIGADSCAVLMEALPPLNHDELATRADLALTRRELRADMAQLRGELSEFKGEVALQLARQLRLTLFSHFASMIGLAALLIGFG